MKCTHLGQMRDVVPSAQSCEECLQMGDTWVHLRMPRMLTRWLLQFKQKQARLQALPRYQPPYYQVLRAGRGLAMVLYRRGTCLAY